MGQVQILSIMLCVCMLGIVLSAGVITNQTESAMEHRQRIVAELQRVAEDARRIYTTAGSEALGSFLPLTATPSLFRNFIRSRSRTGADFVLRTPGSVSSLEICALGRTTGIDGRRPVRVILKVYPDRSTVSILN